MKILDLYCGSGGAAFGINTALNKLSSITGVDKAYQPFYPYQLIMADALSLGVFFIQHFDIVWASPPCQAYTWSNAYNRDPIHEDLVGSTRELLLKADVPFIIENVELAPIRKDLVLCGEMFGKRFLRHRHFELHKIKVPQPEHLPHRKPVQRWSKKSKEYVTRSWYYSIAGNGGFSYSYKLSDWKEAMGIGWINKGSAKEQRSYLVECVPPVYSQYIFENMEILK